MQDSLKLTAAVGGCLFGNKETAINYSWGHRAPQKTAPIHFEHEIRPSVGVSRPGRGTNLELHRHRPKGN